jgi:2-alkenal reductase
MKEADLIGARIITSGIVLIFLLSACNLSDLTAGAPPAMPAAETTAQETSREAVATEEVASQESRPHALPVVAQTLPTLAPSPTPLSASAIAEADAEESLLMNIYERVNPSVVNIVITVANAQADSTNQMFPTQGQGSGFIIDTAGHIVTNNHVVVDAEKIEVTFYDGTTLEAKYIGADSDSDIAVIQVDASAEALRPVVWGDSDEVRVGQRAVAIGNPFGLAGSLTSGIISALGRSLPTENGVFRIPEIIQTDAAINPGNSGGPLLNSLGEVIGMNTAIVPRRSGFGGERSFLGVGFAVPANLVAKVAPHLIEEGKYQHPWIGFSGNTVTKEIADAMELPEAFGALVVQVISGSPADEAGLRSGTREVVFENGVDTTIGGDVIIAIDGEEIRTFDDLISFLSRRGEVGQIITLTVIREGKEQQLKMTLGPRPESSEE